MFALTHIYCAKKIKPSSDDLFCYGAVFPDIHFVGLPDFGKNKNTVFGFRNLINSKSKKLSSFSDGMLIHEEPFGLDRFGHGLNGYAFVEGKKILNKLDFILEKDRLGVAHLLIEFAIERFLLEDNPELLNLANDTKTISLVNSDEISNLTSDYFKLNISTTKTLLEKYNNMLYFEDYSNRLLDFLVKYIKSSRNVDFENHLIIQAISEAQGVIKDTYRVFLIESINKCDSEFKSFIN